MMILTFHDFPTCTQVLGCIALGWFVLWNLILSDIGFLRELLGIDKKVKKTRTQSAARRRRNRQATERSKTD